MRKPRRESRTETPLISIKPTRTFHIVPHGGLCKTIKVLDITDQVTADFGSDAFKQQAKDVAKQSPPAPCLTVTRTPRWYSKNFVVESAAAAAAESGDDDDGSGGGGGGKIAAWKAGAMSSSTNYLTFPEDSPHSTHNLTMETKSYWKCTEQFVQDSVAYVWAAESMWLRRFTLWKHIGNERVEVGRYWQGWEPFATGGTLVLDTDEVHEVVGILTCLVVLRKKRQKEMERRNLSGG